MKMIIRLTVVLALVMGMIGVAYANAEYELIFYEDFEGSRVSSEWVPDAARTLADPRTSRLTKDKVYSGNQSFEFVSNGGMLTYNIPDGLSRGRIEMYIYDAMDVVLSRGVGLYANGVPVTVIRFGSKFADPKCYLGDWTDLAGNWQKRDHPGEPPVERSEGWKKIVFEISEGVFTTYINDQQFMSANIAGGGVVTSVDVGINWMYGGPFYIDDFKVSKAK
jgi:hypothetical protein